MNNGEDNLKLVYTKMYAEEQAELQVFPHEPEHISAGFRNKNGRYLRA